MKQKIISTLVFSFFLLTVKTAFANNILYAKNSFNSVITPQFGPQSKQDLLYYGGPVISHVKIVTVFWTDKVNPAVKAGIADFYSAYVTSSHMDWLNEYATNIKAVDGREGTGQEIGRGEMIGQKIITPASQANKIQDKEVQAEINRQIANGDLPKPDQNTLYMIHFPASKQIIIEGMTSCFSFGGYHNASVGGPFGDFFYSVIPECSSFGGGGFNEITYVAAHELIEAVTDPYPTPGSQPQFPQAWNAADGNEIADLCTASTLWQAPLKTYNITTLWSNLKNKCYDGK